MTSLTRLVAVLIVGCALAAAGGGTAWAQAPPTLSGEGLVEHILFPGPVTTGNCSTDPATGETSYSLAFSGIAVGPYAGTFTETIDVTIGPATSAFPLPPFFDGFISGASPSDVIAAGQVLTLDAVFTIESPTGTVTGTKTLSAVLPADATHAGLCADSSSQPLPSGITGFYKEVRAYDLTYTATISSSEGTFQDEGTSQAQGRQGRLDSPGGVVSDVNDFTETFESSLTAPTPAASRPGKGCGDEKHLHERREDCKRQP